MAIFRKQPEQDKPNGRAFLPRNPQETAGSPFGPERSAKLPGEDASGLMILAEAQQRKPKIGVKEVQEAASILTASRTSKTGSSRTNSGTSCGIGRSSAGSGQGITPTKSGRSQPPRGCLTP